VNIVKKAIEEPIRQIVGNSGIDASIVFEKVREGTGSFGFNAQSDEYGDLFKMGVIDPTKVVRTALLNASSVAALMLTTDCMVAERPKREKAGGGGGGHGGGMGGMGGMGGGDMDY